MENLLLPAICIVLISVCSTYKNSMNADANMKKVELKISKKEVTLKEQKSE